MDYSESYFTRYDLPLAILNDVQRKNDSSRNGTTKLLRTDMDRKITRMALSDNSLIMDSDRTERDYGEYKILSIESAPVDELEYFKDRTPEMVW